MVCDVAPVFCVKKGAGEGGGYGAHLWRCHIIDERQMLSVMSLAATWHLDSL